MVSLDSLLDRPPATAPRNGSARPAPRHKAAPRRRTGAGPAALTARLGTPRRVVVALLALLLVVVAVTASVRAATSSPSADGGPADGPTSAAGDPVSAVREARQWVEDNVSTGERVLVDDVVHAELVAGGFPAARLVRVGADEPVTVPAAVADGPATDHDYVLLTEALQASLPDDASAEVAVARGTEVAAFGSGAAAIQVLQVQARSAGAVQQAVARDDAARIAAGPTLAANPGLRLTPAAEAALTGGEVDARLMILLASLAGGHVLSVTDFPVVPGEDGVVPARTVSIDGVDDQPVGGTATTDLQAELDNQVGSFRAGKVTLDGGALVVQFPPTAPTDLLPEP